MGIKKVLNNYFLQDNLGMVLIGAGVFKIIVLYLVISYATKSDRRVRYEWAQLMITAKMAKGHGVPPDEIEAIFKSAGLGSKSRHCLATASAEQR